MSSIDNISRRSFAAAAALMAIAPAGAFAAPPRRLVKPPRLRAGGTIGLIAPGGYTDDESIARAVARVEQMGFRARTGANLRAVYGSYAGTIAQRVADLHAMFADPDVGAIWCMRGGSGCVSLLSSIDYRLLRAHPKILIGYSDITALHLALYRQAGLVSFHGPVAISGPSDYSLQHMLAVLMEPQPTYTIHMAPENAARAITEPQFGVRTVVHGQAVGPLIGGNLAIIAALAGTPYAADFRKALLFIEEVREAPYRIDRWLTQLDLAVGLRRAAGVMVGVMDKCVPPDGDPSLTLQETLDLHLKPLTVPAVTGYSFGHIRHQFTLPVGIRARLDTLRQTVTLLEPAVR